MDMSHAMSLEPVQAKSNEAFVFAIARDTATSVDLVRMLYEEEVAALTEGATVRQFIGVSPPNTSNSNCERSVAPDA